MNEQASLQEKPMSVKLKEDGEFLMQRMKTWQQKPIIHFVAYFLQDQASLLADTIDTLTSQLYQGWKLTIISQTPIPDNRFETLPQLNWITTEDKYPIALAQHLGECEDEWIGLLHPGDQLEMQLLLLLVDTINSNPSWKMIYTDEDLFNEQGDIIKTINKPDFDPEQLGNTDIIGNGVFISKLLFHQIDGLSGFCDSSRQLGLKVAKQTGDYSIGHIPVVLYHTHA